MLVLLIILIFLVSFFCLLPYFRAMYKRWRYWDDPENDPRWGREQFQFSTSPKLAREPIYNRLSNSTLDTMSEGEPGSRVGSRIGSRVGSRVGINREGSFRNSCGLPRYICIIQGVPQKLRKLKDYYSVQKVFFNLCLTFTFEHI